MFSGPDEELTTVCGRLLIAKTSEHQLDIFSVWLLNGQCVLCIVALIAKRFAKKQHKKQREYLVFYMLGFPTEFPENISVLSINGLTKVCIQSVDHMYSTPFLELQNPVLLLSTRSL
jgi:hypothetical protein